jgi:hypothetical protein
VISSATATPVETIDLIAGVLSRAHQTVEDLNSPNEARVILNVAQMFADELADLDPDFDRLQFIEDITEDPQLG